jgi:hypothetical protein
MLYQSAVTGALKRGARLRYPIRDVRGVLLLGRGAEVTDRLLELLRQRGITLTTQASLKTRQGAPEGLEIPICKDRLLTGRWPECNVQLADPRVSGRHCLLVRRLNGVFLQDLGSRNGTYLNGQPLREEVELSDQETLRVVEATFTVHLYAALAADLEAASQALDAWILAVSAGRPAPAALYAPTEPSMDFDSLLKEYQSGRPGSA